MSLEDCNKKIRYLSSQHSFSSGKEVINENFESLSGCLEHALTEITNLQQATANDFPIIFPTNPNSTIEYNLIYANGKYFLTQDTGGSGGGGSDKYWLQAGEQLVN